MKKLLTILSFIISIVSCGKTSSITGGDNGGLPHGKTQKFHNFQERIG